MRNAAWTRTLGVSVFIVVFLAFFLAACSGGGNNSTVGTPMSSVTGQINVSLSDPPTCKGPLAPSDTKLDNVWVTITRVRAHLSASAGANDSGWVDLVDLRSNPVQIDLLNTSSTQCILSMLGGSSGLPAGNYQQIRLYLLSNTPAGNEATPSSNACQSVGGFNCVKPSGGPLQVLNLSSEAQTGIKIPPGRIAGGALSLEAGQSADINIDFDACNSIVLQGNGQYRLLPTLHAGEVSTTTDTLAGQVVVDGTTTAPPNATIVVLLEQPDSDGVDRVVMQKTAGSNGSFSFCPLPPGTYDVVVAAQDGAGVTYNATVIFGVTSGSNLGNIPLVPEPGPDTSPGTIEGVVTTAATSAATAADIRVSALQSATPAGASTPVLFTVPLFGDSTDTVTTAASTSSLTCPLGTDCAQYTLHVPASNPKVGTFASGSVTFDSATPAAPPAAYTINAQAFVPGSGSVTPDNCSPSSLTTDKLDDGTTALTVDAGATATAAQLDFTGCQTGF